MENGVIEIKKGIEVGHIFQLGKVYAEYECKVDVLNQEGKAIDLFMGCYGIGVSRLVAATQLSKIMMTKELNGQNQLPHMR